LAPISNDRELGLSGRILPGSDWVIRAKLFDRPPWQPLEQLIRIETVWSLAFGERLFLGLEFGLSLV
jgi:hypothetical protein